LKIQKHMPHWAQYTEQRQKKVQHKKINTDPVKYTGVNPGDRKW